MPNSDDFNRYENAALDIGISRSMFNMDHGVKFSCNVGDLIPFEVREVLPGDTFEYETTKVVRTQPLVTPVMDELILDTYYFFIPARLCWDHWINFMGENTSSAWTPQVTYNVPQISAPSGGWQTGTIADYMGIPVGVSGFSVNALPLRAYAKVCDEWFRSEALANPVHYYTDDTNRTGVNTDDQVTDIELGGKPFKVAKYHDYFTAALPDRQRGAAPTFSLGSDAWVYPSDDTLSNYQSFYNHKSDAQLGVAFAKMVGSNMVYANSGVTNGADLTFASGSRYLTGNKLGSAGNIDRGSQGTPAEGYPYFPYNLKASTSDLLTFDVNDIRTAFAIQRYLEKSARAGGRYIEMIKAFFNVDSPDSRLQRSEYLGGNRMPLNINAVEQTSSTDQISPQGNVAGFSVTGDVNGDFVKSFTEHGFVIGVSCVRYKHSYQQGLERFWSRRSIYDYYNPVFANLSEMPIKNKEIYVSGNVVTDDETFGFQEAWADYRTAQNRIAGLLRSTATSGTSLDVWHFGDEYASKPSLGASWIREDYTNVDRTLAVNASVADQLICDYFIKVKAARPMPLYSIPGLIDHN